MQCPSCNRPLPTGAQACPSCGRLLSPAPSNYPTYGPYPPAGPPSSGQHPSGAMPPQAGSPSSGQYPSGAMAPYSYPPAYSNNPQLYTQAPAFPDNNPYQSYPGYIAQPPPPTTPPPRRGLTAVLITLIVVVVLVFVGVGAWLYFTSNSQQGQATNQGTTTPTATIAGTASPSAVPTIPANNPQALYTQATSGTPINILNGGSWLTAKGSCVASSTTVHVAFTSDANTTVGVCANSSLSFDNFAYQAHVTIAQGSLAALLFRFNALSSSAYAFAISPQSVYVLESVQGTNQTSAKILAGANSSTLKSGLNQTNLLTVIARGSTLNIYLNGQFITTITDSTSSAGQVGVLAGASGPNNPVDVTFSDLQVWKL